MIYVSTWNNLGEDDQRPALPDFPSLLKLYDKNGDGAITESEFPDKLLYTARPGLETIPNSQNYVSFRSVDRNKDGRIDQPEWETFRNRVGTMAIDHGLLAIQVKERTSRKSFGAKIHLFPRCLRPYFIKAACSWCEMEVSRPVSTPRPVK